MRALIAALDLAAHGLPVFPVHGVSEGRCACGRPPCTSVGKHPRTKHGHHDATTDPDQIQMWARVCPGANVGVRTGRGILVLDVDRRSGGLDTLRALEAEHGSLPVTPTVKTGGGGLHFYFAVDCVAPCRTGLWLGIDIKGDGGFVVGPWSIHATGAPYEWVRGRRLGEVPLAPVPAWVLDALMGRASKTTSQKSGGTVLAGGRNNHLMSLAGWLRRRGGGEDAIREALGRANEALCKPPLPETEVARIAVNAARYPTSGGAGASRQFCKPRARLSLPSSPAVPIAKRWSRS